MPQEPAYLCLQQVRAWASLVRTIGFSLAKSPGHSPGGHGHGSRARIHQKATAKEWNREAITDGSDSDSFDEKTNLITIQRSEAGRATRSSHEQPWNISLVPPGMYAWTGSASQMRHLIRLRGDSAPSGTDKPH